MTKPFVFVLMPFDSSFDDTYKLGIKAAAEEVGTYCERVDEQYFEERILERIYNQIAAADFIVADLSERNPNVFYETGYAHALNKRVVLLVNRSEDIPFDLKHHPHIVYNGRIAFLKEELIKRLAFFITNPTVTVTPSIDGLEFLIKGTKLISDVEVEVEETSHDLFIPDLLIQIDIHNTLDSMFSSGFEIALESSIYFATNTHSTNKFSPIVISEKRVLHRGGRVEKLLPSSYTNKFFRLSPKGRPGRLEFLKAPFILRISNEIKSYAIPFIVNIKPREGFGSL